MTSKSQQMVQLINNANQRRFELVKFFVEQYLKIKYIYPDDFSPKAPDDPRSAIWCAINPAADDHPDFVVIDGGFVHMYQVQILAGENLAYPHASAVQRYTLTLEEFHKSDEEIVNDAHELALAYHADKLLAAAVQADLARARATADAEMERNVLKYLDERGNAFLDLLKKNGVSLT